jgi:hypothetical protein
MALGAREIKQQKRILVRYFEQMSPSLQPPKLLDRWGRMPDRWAFRPYESAQTEAVSQGTNERKALQEPPW